MKERLIEFLKAENKSSAQLAEEIGVQPSGISHILSGRNNPSLDFVLKMLETYHFISTDWLLFGKGNMYKDISMQNLFTQNAGIKKKESEIQLEDRLKHTESDISELNKVDQNTASSDTISQVKNKSGVQRIVIFYDNKSFEEYFPGN